MSFLQDLQNSKLSLRNTETIITYIDGSKYVENSHFCQVKFISQNSTAGFVIDTAPDYVPAFVTPGIYIGSQDSAIPDILFQHNIEAVLSIGIKPCNIHPNISYSYVPCLDLPETEIKNVLDTCNKIIKKYIDLKKNILVHCNAGVSRSASVVIGYLILEKHKSYDEAFNVVKSVRPCIQPNIGFIKQLQNLY